MTKKEYSEFKSWCFSSGSIGGREIGHQELGLLRIVSVDTERKKVSLEDGKSISQQYILDNFEALLDWEDIQKLESQYNLQKKEEETIQREKEEIYEREKEKRLAKIADFRNVCLKLSEDMKETINNFYIIPPIVTYEDEMLIQGWIGDNMQPRDSEESAKRRMESARLAEKALIKFLEQECKDVVDVSITQIEENNDGAWKKYDINADGRSIDVKNSRRRYRKDNKDDDNSYTSHCVPRFKQDEGQRDVEIAGVLSHYYPINQEGELSNVLFLGFTDIEKINYLKSEMGGGLLRVNFNDVHGVKFFPPGVFDYDDSFYNPREEAVLRLSNLNFPDEYICAEEELNPIAAFISAGIDYSPTSKVEFSESQAQLISSLAGKAEDGKLSLAVIYLSILENFVTMLSKYPDDIYWLKEYEYIIFPTQNKQLPLFIYDPLKIIHTLLRTLETLWDEKESYNLEEFVEFRLQNLNILQGRRKSDLGGTWQTLIAYCGGRNEEDYPCGKNPIVIGKCENCDNGRLICSDCGYCCESHK